jgi:hypothetical protein
MARMPPSHRAKVPQPENFIIETKIIESKAIEIMERLPSSHDAEETDEA